MAYPEEFKKVFEENSFFFNPRDENRILYYIFKNPNVPDEKKTNALKAWKLGNDNQYFEMYKAFSNEIKFISKIVKFKEKDGEILAYFQNGFVSRFDPKMLADNPDDAYNLLQSYLLIKIKKSTDSWEICDIMPVEPAKNVDIAKQLLQFAEAEHTTYSVLLYAFGYDVEKMNADDILVTVPRFFPLFVSPYSKRRYNVIEISNPGTGKTSIFTILQEVFNFRYYTEPPTYANLVYDARNNIYGAVYLSKGLIFDEIQTWKNSTNQKNMEAVNSTLSTGMENCIWTRGAGTESKSAVLHSCLPIVYAGNPYTAVLDKYSAMNVEDYLQQYEIFTPAILDRIHLIHISLKKTYDQIGSKRVLYPSVLKALVDLLQEKLNQQNHFVDCQNFTSRRHEQSVDIQLLLRTLDLQNDEIEKNQDEFCAKLQDYMRFIKLMGD
ncbi:ATPase domain-containing protein [Acidianus rod-shaped virus 3]|uniref:ATPase domain-containing protein n=1 Tax=Acidianus rod-shaped virus 3 TaxID=2730617 RepID=A0A6M3VWL2_9VIRU|nr:ATPase domain-containing protein [Acidianus rod-shaped virus 3]QJF12324.1 ATPase domain-containing protein [Acidianus rod-shaped virus 3]